MAQWLEHLIAVRRVLGSTLNGELWKTFNFREAKFDP